ncbi:MAG: hypothetical protein ACRDPO_00160 [Streptosporangiaceae bacterium]
MMLAAVLIAVAFVVLAAALCAAAVLAVLGAANVYLSGPEAIERDGLARGQRAPRWSLADSAGAVHHSPPARPLQLVVFADHSLKSFPSVLDGLRDLIARGDPDLEVVVLLRQRNDLAEPLLRMLLARPAAPAGPDLPQNPSLDGVPVLTGTPALYAAYNVRVGPFAIFVDAAGQVRASSLVNYDWQLGKLRQVAGLPIGPAPAPRRPARTGLRRLSRRAA